MSKTLSRLLLTILFLAPAYDQVNAQVTPDQRERRRAMVGDLLKTLIESQMQRDPGSYSPPGRPNHRQFPPKGHQPSQPLTANMLSARAKVQAWETEADALVKLLRQQEQRVPRVRPLLADALTTTANIKSLRTNMGRVHSLAPLTDAFCQIDSDWRLLNFQLTQLNGIAPECRACCKRMMSFDRELCALFEVQPQFNRVALGRYCTQMASQFQHLIQDVRYDMRGEPNYATILSDCQKICTRLHEADRLIARGSYDSVVKLYKASLADWRKVKYKLAGCPHGRVNRDVHQIENIGRHMSELLWIPADIDRAYLTQVISGIEREVGNAFCQISLKDVLACKAPGQIMQCSREFQTQCGKLSNALKANKDQEALLWEFKQFSNQWGDLQQHFAGFKTPAVGRSVVQIESGFEVLQGTFGDGPLIDRATMNGICSNLDQLSYRLSDFLVLNTKNNYDAALRDEICECSSKFHKCIHEMHEHTIADRRHAARAEADVRVAVAAWQQMRPLLAKCKPKHQKVISNFRSQIEPLMVKLQVVFAG